MNFWQKLKKPIFALAPMDGVTDTVFRQIVLIAGQTCLPAGRPDVFFTEFVPVDALFSKGKEKILKTLAFSEKERPIVAQIWGYNPQNFYKAAQILAKLKFDGIDINMGCPDKSVVKKGAGAALIKNPMLAQEIIQATIKGAKGLPVSVKTRIGFESIDTKNWVTTLLQTPIAALILHLRTASEMSKAPAHWDQIKIAVDIRRKLQSEALIIGNGDIKILQEAEEKYKEYGIDGVMIGRGIFENVYFFNKQVKNVLPKQKIQLLNTHLKLFKQTYGDQKHFELLKKFVKCYVNNFDGAFDNRMKLMQTKTLEELMKEAKKLQLSQTC